MDTPVFDLSRSRGGTFEEVGGGGRGEDENDLDPEEQVKSRPLVYRTGTHKKTREQEDQPFLLLLFYFYFSSF
jgi:hypothetical protein